MGFYDEAVNVLETIAKALSGAFSYGAMAAFCDRSQAKVLICPEFSKTAVRMKSISVRPSVQSLEEHFSNPKSNRQRTNIFQIQGGFYL